MTDDTPGIVVPRDWRWQVANLPHGQWVRWRDRSTAILASHGRPATAEDIEAADLAAWHQLKETALPLTCGETR